MSNVSEEQHLNSNIITINSNRIRLIKNSPPQVNVRNPSTFNDLMNLFFVFWQTLDVSYGHMVHICEITLNTNITHNLKIITNRTMGSFFISKKVQHN